MSSCAFFNDKDIYVPIKSRPSGANVYIDGKYFGDTPTRIKLDPSKNHRATLVKKGYGTSSVDLETWYSVRGGRGADNARCALDALGVMLIIPAFSFYSVRCRDFKKREYIVDIGHNDFRKPDSDMNLEVMEEGVYRKNYRTTNPNNNSLYQDNYIQDNGQYGGYNQDNNSGYGNNSEYDQPYGGRQR
jgi:hypothetical protein